MDDLLVFLSTLLICALLTPVLINVAKSLGLVDCPTTRKRHLKPTPLVGGLAIYASVCASVLFFSTHIISPTLLAWFGLALAIGLADDWLDVRFQVRLFCQAGVVLGILLTHDLAIYNLGTLFSSNPVNFQGIFVVLFTIVAVLGAANSVNMSDGVDGLAASLTLMSLLAILSMTNANESTNNLVSHTGILAFAGGLTAFLLFNSRLLIHQAAVFLGDAGTTMLGFALAYILIEYTQGDDSLLNPVVAGWILGLPLLDASAVILYRVINKRSPFHPDRDHLHHIFLDSGMTTNKTVLALLIIHFGLIATGIAISTKFGHAADSLLFWGFVSLVVARVALTKVYLPNSLLANDNTI